MAVLLALVAALAYGASDFGAGVAGRRTDPTVIALLAVPGELLATAVALLVARPATPDAAALGWGALAGVGSAIGTLALYRGLAAGRMSVVAPLSAVLTAALPALLGVLTGDQLSALAWLGIVAALPAILLVSSEHEESAGEHAGSRRAGVGYGLVAGAGFALLLIGLARAGTDSGAWPIVPVGVVSLVLLGAVTAAGRASHRAGTWSLSWRLGTAVGALAGAANIAFLAATGRGSLTVVAVLTGLYPAVTVVLARVLLQERWGRAQSTGLLVAALAVSAISFG